jgi:hypothetical protein
MTKRKKTKGQTTIYKTYTSSNTNQTKTFEVAMGSHSFKIGQTKLL